MVISNVTRSNLLPNILLKNMTINYEETFLPVFKRGPLKIIMALMSHYDLELHQMYVNTTFS